MKKTGMIRQIDELGRITLPIELRRTLDIEEHDALEISLEGDAVVLRKYEPCCIFCGGMRDLRTLRGKNVCHACREALQDFTLD